MILRQHAQPPSRPSLPPKSSCTISFTTIFRTDPSSPGLSTQLNTLHREKVPVHRRAKKNKPFNFSKVMLSSTIPQGRSDLTCVEEAECIYPTCFQAIRTQFHLTRRSDLTPAEVIWKTKYLSKLLQGNQNPIQSHKEIRSDT